MNRPHSSPATTPLRLRDAGTPFLGILFFCGAALFAASAHGRDELKAYDAYFSPDLELTDEQKSELIPHIRKRHGANQGSKFQDRPKATLFGQDLSETQAAEKLNRPEDQAVRKIITMSQAQKLERYLKENKDRITQVKSDFPLLRGEFFMVTQSLTLNESQEYELKLNLEAQVPSSKYKIVPDDVTRDRDSLTVKVSIVRPHPFQLFEEAPTPQTISHVLAIEEPFPKKFIISMREVPEFDSESEYPAQREGALLQPSELE